MSCAKPMVMRHSRTAQAQRDIDQALRASIRLFGVGQARIYAELIDTVIDLLADDPERPSSRARPDLGPDVRSFHLEIAGGRRGAASHCVYYQVVSIAGHDTEVVVLRVLHDAMDPGRKVGIALRGTRAERR